MRLESERVAVWPVVNPQSAQAETEAHGGRVYTTEEAAMRRQAKAKARALRNGKKKREAAEATAAEEKAQEGAQMLRQAGEAYARRKAAEAAKSRANASKAGRIRANSIRAKRMLEFANAKEREIAVRLQPCPYQWFASRHLQLFDEHCSTVQCTVP